MLTLYLIILKHLLKKWIDNKYIMVPMQYCSLQRWTWLPSPVTSTTGRYFCFGSVSSFFLELFLHWSPSSSMLGTYWPGEFIFQCPIFLPFHTVHGVLKARMLKWFAIPFSSGPCFVKALHQDPSILGGPTRHGSLFHWVKQGCGPCFQLG